MAQCAADGRTGRCYRSLPPLMVPRFHPSMPQGRDTRRPIPAMLLTTPICPWFCQPARPLLRQLAEAARGPCSPSVTRPSCGGRAGARLRGRWERWGRRGYRAMPPRAAAAMGRAGRPRWRQGGRRGAGRLRVPALRPSLRGPGRPAGPEGAERACPGRRHGPRRPAVSAGRPPPRPLRGLCARGERPPSSAQRRRPASGRGSRLGRGCCGSGGRAGRGRPGPGGRGGLSAQLRARWMSRASRPPCPGSGAARHGGPGAGSATVPALRCLACAGIRCAGRRTCGCLGSSCCELRPQRACSVRFRISRVLISEKGKHQKHPVCVQR